MIKKLFIIISSLDFLGARATLLSLQNLWGSMYYMISYELGKVVLIRKIWVISPTKVICVQVRVPTLAVVYKNHHILVGLTYDNHLVLGMATGRGKNVFYLL